MAFRLRAPAVSVWVALPGASGAPAIEASFDHGEDDGYGLWLDPSIKDNPVYAENWAGHRPVKVTVEADQIVIRKA